MAADTPGRRQPWNGAYRANTSHTTLFPALIATCIGAFIRTFIGTFTGACIGARSEERAENLSALSRTADAHGLRATRNPMIHENWKFGRNPQRFDERTAKGVLLNALPRSTR